MAIQVFEIELTGKIDPIIVDKNYTNCRILIRYEKIPIGWIQFSYRNKRMITSEDVLAATKKQLDWSIIKNFLTIGKEAVQDEPRIHPISIVVCTRNRTHFLSECIRSLLKLNYPTYEIIIIDNAPGNDDTKNLVEGFPVRYVKEDRPGLNWARNRGIDEAKHPIVAFTDDDAKVDVFWLHAINNAFQNENIVAVSGLVAPTEMDTRAQRMFELGYGGMAHGFVKKYFHRTRLSKRQQLWASSFGIGVNMAFRKQVFDKIGQFNVAFDVGTPTKGGGDVEMFFRLVNSGFSMLYDPAVLVWHTHRKSMNALCKQIQDNGRSTGCYLIHVFRQKRVRRLSILRFFFVEWLWKWNMMNLLKKRRHLSRKLPLYELWGLLSSPFAYWHSLKVAKRLGSNSSEYI